MDVMDVTTLVEKVNGIVDVEEDIIENRLRIYEDLMASPGDLECKKDMIDYLLRNSCERLNEFGQLLRQFGKVIDQLAVLAKKGVKDGKF